ncbi:MAG: hypothetical protein JXL81_10440, partial [Deltaproteobacteria bacterium]|nr:hypothetical protein [Deltaproteobacteria bacterium]
MKRLFYRCLIKYFIAASILICCTNTGFAQEPLSLEKKTVSIKKLRDLPIINQGRYKPFDSIARQALLELSGKSTIKDNGKKYTASQWLAETIFIPEHAVNFRIFLLENPEVADAIGLMSEMKRVRYSYNDISPHLDQLEKL